MTDARQWYFMVGERQVGPMDFEELRRRAELGGFGPADLVWQEGMADWTPAGLVSGLTFAREQLHAAQPPAVGEVFTPGAEPEPVEYAGFWRRLVAWILDVLILSAAGLALGCMLGGQADADSGPHFNPLMWLINLGYYVAFEASRYQATPGKMALGLSVTDAAGRRVSVPRALGRNLAKILSGLLLAIGYIMVAFTARKQGLHDLIAGTLVVRRPRI